QIVRSTIKARLCGIHLFYDRKFDVDPDVAVHSNKLGFPSSQTHAVKSCVPGRYVLLLGIGHSNVTRAIKEKLCHVTAIDFSANERLARSTTAAVTVAPVPSLPTQLNFDQVLVLDLIEHLHDPE